MKKFLIKMTIVFFLAGCLTVPSVSERRENADRIARENGFTRISIRTVPFILTAYEKVNSPGSLVRIYIEGDGYAFVTRNRVSWDPTPRNPVAFRLAVQDDSANIVYLARPCQYTAHEKDVACDFPYWTSARFSDEVIRSMEMAVSSIVEKTQASGVELIGYSGGAAVAVLIAERRSDVRSIRSVAGNLDSDAVNEYHGVTPLSESLNPVDSAEKIKQIPQIHFSGLEDEIIPESALSSFVRRSGPEACLEIVRVRGADHEMGWVESWPELLNIPFKVCNK
ncbi:MAG: hypothetical protein BWY44_01484 [Candidatus Omnitrophica bacterium ADurb.Bin292]|nr:MAG: hypothetical protein BWY44_01484 [Candidatus Omnitrophica bacterium ADurb.Bin292]